MSKYRIIGDLDYIQGHLRYGHLELEIEKEKWDSMTKEEQEEYLADRGDLIVDDYSVEDRGGICKIEKEEI